MKLHILNWPSCSIVLFLSGSFIYKIPSSYFRNWLNTWLSISLIVHLCNFQNFICSIFCKIRLSTWILNKFLRVWQIFNIRVCFVLRLTVLVCYRSSSDLTHKVLCGLVLFEKKCVWNAWVIWIVAFLVLLASISKFL